MVRKIPLPTYIGILLKEHILRSNIKIINVFATGNLNTLFIFSTFHLNISLKIGQNFQMYGKVLIVNKNIQSPSFFKYLLLDKSLFILIPLNPLLLEVEALHYVTSLVNLLLSLTIWPAPLNFRSLLVTFVFLTIYSYLIRSFKLIPSIVCSIALWKTWQRLMLLGARVVCLRPYIICSPYGVSAWSL